MALERSTSSPRAQGGVGRRRVRAIVAIPVIALCGSLGALAGVLFPVHPAPVSDAADTLQRNAEVSPQGLVPGGVPPVVSRAEPEREAVGTPPSRDVPAPRPQVTHSESAKALSGAAAAREPAGSEAPADVAASQEEKRQHARHEAFDRRARVRRERYAALRKRAAGAANAQKGQLLQIPLVGSVAGLLMQ
jgi:hypothetical protein